MRLLLFVSALAVLICLGVVVAAVLAGKRRNSQPPRFDPPRNHF